MGLTVIALPFNPECHGNKLQLPLLERCDLTQDDIRATVPKVGALPTVL